MTAPRTGRWTHWRDMRWAYIAVWMLFLAYPIGAIATSDHSIGAKAIGFGLIAGFAIVYLLAAVYLLGRRAEFDRRGIWVFALLAALAAGLLPLLGKNVFGMAPYLMVVAAFTFPFASAAAVVGTLIVAAVAVPSLLGDDADLGVVVVLAAVGVSMLGFRVLAVREGERERAEERQRELNSQLAIVAERERVARDVHDILGHSLTVITVKTELAGRLVDLDPQRAKAEMAEVNTLARNALAEVRTTVGQLQSPDLPSTIRAAESALRASGIQGQLPDPHVATENAELFAWVLREAVTNVVRHSGASRCDVDVDERSIMVCDNGHGFGEAAFGNGLRGLSERVKGAGGDLEFDSDATGTRLRATVH